MNHPLTVPALILLAYAVGAVALELYGRWLRRGLQRFREAQVREMNEAYAKARDEWRTCALEVADALDSAGNHREAEMIRARYQAH